MGKLATNVYLDQPLDYANNNADLLVLNNAEPADYSDATTLKSNGGTKLADVAIGSADFTIADGDTDGRKITVAAQNNVSVDEDGTVSHISIVNDSGTELLYVTTLGTNKDVNAGDNADVSAFDDEFGDPT